MIVTNAKQTTFEIEKWRWCPSLKTKHCKPGWRIIISLILLAAVISPKQQQQQLQYSASLSIPEESRSPHVWNSRLLLLLHPENRARASLSNYAFLLLPANSYIVVYFNIIRHVLYGTHGRILLRVTRFPPLPTLALSMDPFFVGGEGYYANYHWEWWREENWDGLWPSRTGKGEGIKLGTELFALSAASWGAGHQILS